MRFPRVVEVEVRVDQEAHPRGVDAERRQSARDVLAGREVHLEVGGRRLAETPDGVCPRGGMHAAVEEHETAGVIDQIGGDRHAQLARLADEEVARRPGQPAAGEGEEAHREARIARPPLAPQPG